jgi:hypothetical protein
MVTCLWLIGREADATTMFERLLGLRNDVGLLSEEYDPGGKRMVGNFPQALSHIALLHSAFAMSGLWRPQPLIETKDFSRETAERVVDRGRTKVSRSYRATWDWSE